jgi:hypothetical protein
MRLPIPSEPVDFYYSEAPLESPVELWIGKKFIATSNPGDLIFFEGNPPMPINLVTTSEVELRWPSGREGVWSNIYANTLNAIVTSNLAIVQDSNTITIPAYDSGTVDIELTNNEGKKNTLVFTSNICGLKFHDWS